MLLFSFVYVLSLGFVFGQLDWVSRARVPNPSGYFSQLVQELVYDLEKLEWCNLKVDEYSKTLNEQLYKWHVNGTVTYKNGFVVSIQELDLSNVESTIFNRYMEADVFIPHAHVSGRLNMRNVKIGFDVIVDLVNPEPPHAPQQRYTGHYTHTLIQLQLQVTRNLLTHEMESSPYWLSVTGGSGIRMIYMPANNITEVLSRRYAASDNTDAVSNWSREIIGPMLVDISTNRVPFPDICYNNCPT